ncbi:hypothetical protein MMC21_005133 [Puttea exsequens]|nr:hypothetical protein [Puttea exsequens]
MQGDKVAEVGETGTADAPGEEDETLAFSAEKPAPRVTFVDYLKPPIIILIIGSGADETILIAHEALLIHFPFFAEAIQPDSTSSERSIELLVNDLEATSCFLEYHYAGEYLPHKLPTGTLQSDSSTPAVDDSGDQLLKHAKVYTLAEKLGLPAPRALLHSKIHLITSTALAEITYA